MRFQVPQFINIEDKIFGPFTLRQFIYLAGGLGLAFTLYRLLNFFIAVLLIIPVLALAAALAFLKVNEKPFIEVLESALRYVTGSRLYLWEKTQKSVPKKEAGVKQETSYVPRLSESRLKELAWSLDIKEIASPGVKETMGEKGNRRSANRLLSP